LSATIVSLFVLLTARRLVRRRLDKRQTPHGLWLAELLLRAVASTTAFALFVLSLLIGVKLLELPLSWQAALSRLWFVAIVLQATFWATNALTYFIDRYTERHPEVNLVTMTLVGIAVRTFLWAVAILAILDNIGVNITAFVASLGI